MSDKQAFGDVLAMLRKQKGLTQQGVADQIGVTRSAVYGFEKGRSFPVPDKLVVLAHFFEVSVDYLLTGEEYVPPVKTGKIPPQSAEALKTSLYNADELFPKEAPLPQAQPDRTPGKTTVIQGQIIQTRLSPGMDAQKPAPQRLPGQDFIEAVAKHDEAITQLRQELAELREQVQRG